MPEEKLAGLAEVADLLGVTKRTASRYASRTDFPEPVDRLKAGPIWRQADVEAWGDAHLPLREGRPSRSEA